MSLCEFLEDSLWVELSIEVLRFFEGSSLESKGGGYTVVSVPAERLWKGESMLEVDKMSCSSFLKMAIVSYTAAVIGQMRVYSI